jgi:hypothetical protein
MARGDDADRAGRWLGKAAVCRLEGGQVLLHLADGDGAFTFLCRKLGRSSE